MGRGRKTQDRSGWMRPGGPLPAKAPGLKADEQRHYKWLIGAMAALGVGGRSDLLSVKLAARLTARCERLQSELYELESSTVRNAAGGVVMHPLYAELGRCESRLRDCLCGLYLSPRTRGTTRLPAESQAEADQGDEMPSALLKILG